MKLHCCLSLLLLPVVFTACTPAYQKETDVTLLGNVEDREIWQINAQLPSGPWSYVVASEPLEQILQSHPFKPGKERDDMDIILLRDLGTERITLNIWREHQSGSLHVVVELDKKPDPQKFDLKRMLWGYTCHISDPNLLQKWKHNHRISGTFTQATEFRDSTMVIEPDYRRGTCDLIRLKTLP